MDGPPSDWLDPPFRKVWFDDFPAVVIVSTHLRHAWTAIPPSESPTEESVGAFIKANHELPLEQREQLPKNSDKDSIDSPWREIVLRFWTHVFVDVSGFLQEVGPGIGHVHPDDHKGWRIEYPEPNGRLQPDVQEKVERRVTKKVWDTNVFLIPAFLEPGVSLRATINRVNEDGSKEEAELGTFDASNPGEIWYLRRGVEINVYVEGEYEKDNEGVAAVLAVGLLCL